MAFIIVDSSQKKFNYIGLWKPIKHVESDIIGLPNSEISNLMKSTVSLNESTFIFFGEKSIKPKYTLHKEQTIEFINSNYRIDSKKLGLSKDSIQVLTVDLPASDPMPPIDFIIFENKMIVNNDGVFIFLEKIK